MTQNKNEGGEIIPFPTEHRGGPLLSDAFMDLVADLKATARSIPPGLYDHDMLRLFDKNGDCHGSIYVGQFRRLLIGEEQ